MNVQVLVFAKEPVPGRVKTRLCPPCTYQQAAALALAALADTVDAVQQTPAVRRTLVIDGSYQPPTGWAVVGQRGAGLGQRLAHAFADTAMPGMASLLIGMDTPQVPVALLADVADRLNRADAVLGPAVDGGWWVLALREPRHAAVLWSVPMSTPDTMVTTLEALRRQGLSVTQTRLMRDVDTAADAWAVARGAPMGRFAAAVRCHLPSLSSAKT